MRDDASDSRAASAARRTALFSDQKFGPTLWSTLARESLLRLGEDYQRLLSKGVPAPAPAPIASAAPGKTVQPPGTPLLRKPIYQASQRSPISKVLDTFASDSDFTKATDAIASEVGARMQEAPIPELFRSTAAPPPVATAAAPPSTTVLSGATILPNFVFAYTSHAKAQCLSLADKHAPPWCRQAVAQWDAWWRRDRINKVAEKCLPNRDLDALIIEGGFSVSYAAGQRVIDVLMTDIDIPQCSLVSCAPR